MLRNYLTRFPHPIRGISHALRRDVSFRSQVYMVGLVIIGIFFWLQPLTSPEMLFVLLAYILILITELQNSALEAALDVVHPAQHPAVGRSKDMAAGAVLLAGIFLLVVVAVLLWTRL